MKLLQIVEPGRAEWRDAPIPEPGEGEVLIKILGVTTCPHWDIHLMAGEPMFAGGRLSYPYTPGQPGHEAMGEVVSLGPGVAEPPVGARVVCWRDAGHQRQGCYAQYAAVLAENLLEVPSDAAPQSYAPLELAMCVRVSFQSLEKLGAVEGKRFGVAGLGPAGLVAVQMARAAGAAQVVGIDPLPERRQLALELGADVAIAPDGQELPSGRRTPNALDAAIDCTGLKGSVEFLMDRTRQAVALFGVLRDEVSYGFRHWTGLSLLGYSQHNQQAAREALDLVLAGALNLRPLVTHSLPFTRYPEALELLRKKTAIKICFLPWE